MNKKNSHIKGNAATVQVAGLSREQLTSAIACELDAAAEAESRRTMERSLLINYIADAIEHTCTPDVGTPCIPCGVTTEQASKGKRTP